MDYVWVEQFGAVGDGVTDDTTAIQAAIDSCIASTSIKKVKFRPKTYLISGPLILAKLSASTYSFFNVDLEGSVNANAGVTGQSTKIKCTHTDTFAIGLQNARSCSIRNLVIEGGRVDASKTSKNVAEYSVENWAVSGVRDTVYSPYSGIVIDPFGTSVPSDGGYPNLSSHYNATAAGSSGVSIYNCFVYYFTVDVMISPSGSTSNAESINVYNCRLYNSKVAWASGQSQTRNCRLVDSAIYYALNGIDTMNYGFGTGSCCVIDSLIVSLVRNIVVTSTSRQILDFRAIYAENFWKIGFISGSKRAKFKGCTFKFNFGDTSIPYPDSMLTGNSETHFDNCEFYQQSGSATFNLCFKNQAVTFESCDLSSINIPYSDNITVNKSIIYGYDCGSTSRVTGATPEGFYNFGGSTIRKNAVNLANAIYHHIRPNNNSFRFIATTTLTVSGTEATFTAPNPEYIKVGDIVYGSVSGLYFLDYTNNNATTSNADITPYLGTVKTIVGTTITIKDIRFGLSTGSADIYIQWSNLYFGGILGTLTSGSNVITNVYKEGSGSLVGQRIYLSDPTITSNGLYVASENTGARTLTLSGNVGVSISSAFLYTSYFDIEAIVSVDPTTVTGLYCEKGMLIRSRGTTLTDKLYQCTSPGIVGNATHTPAFKQITMS